MTRDDVRELLAILTEAYPNHVVADPPARVAVWYEVLSPYDNAEIVEASLELIRSGERFQPTPARILSTRRDAVKRRMASLGTAIDYRGEHIPTFQEGIAIAREGYIAERRRLGKPLNLTMFDRFIQTVPRPPEEDETF